MAVKRTARANTERIVREREEAVARLADFGVSPEDTLRFQRAKGTAYVKFNPSYVNADGSIAAYADGGWRAFSHENLERRTSGPRGRTVWTPLSRV